MEGSARFQLELPKRPRCAKRRGWEVLSSSRVEESEKGSHEVRVELVALGVLLALMSTLLEGESETLGVLGGWAAFALAGGVSVLLIVLFSTGVWTASAFADDASAGRARDPRGEGLPRGVSSVPMQAKVVAFHRFAE